MYIRLQELFSDMNSIHLSLSKALSLKSNVLEKLQGILSSNNGKRYSSNPPWIKKKKRVLKLTLGQAYQTANEWIHYAACLPGFQYAVVFL